LQIPPACQYGQQRIATQLFMIVHILVTQSQAINALPQQLPQLVLNQPGLAMIGKALAYSRQQADLAVSFAQQQRPALGAQLPLAKSGAHLPRKMWCKCQLILVTLCHRKGRLSRDVNYDSTTQLCPKMRPFSTSNFFLVALFVYSV